MTAKELNSIIVDLKPDQLKYGLELVVDYLWEHEKLTATPTVKESLTVAPDPGEGWRLIDKERDTPQEGDEMWVKQWHGWYDRGYQRQTAPFEEGTHYRRRVEVATKEPEIAPQAAKTEGREVATKPAIPAGLPPLPEGAVGPMKGGTFKVPGPRFAGWYWEKRFRDWFQSNELGGSESDCYYCFPADSEVARLNGLGEPELTLVSEERDRLLKQLAELRDWTAEQDTRLKLQQDKIATLTKERDALREELNAERMRIKAIREAIGSFNNVIHMTNAAKKEASNDTRD